jgi:two-component system secretion response regulator SsrB
MNAQPSLLLSSSPSPLAGRLSGTQVVLADHDAMVREGLRLLLEQRASLQVAGEAADGLQAVELACDLEPDVVILEARLPALSGIDAAREIARRTECRMIVLTNRSPLPLVQAALDAGVQGYVVKESPCEELLNAIQRVRDGGSYVSPSLAGLLLHAVAGGSSRVATAYSQLTNRERQVLRLIGEGLSSKEIAASLGLALRTIETYRTSLMDKLGIHKVAPLVRFAIREGLIEP